MYDVRGGQRTPTSMLDKTQQNLSECMNKCRGNNPCKKKCQETTSECDQYFISGDKTDASISFEGGPLVKQTYSTAGRYETLWTA